MGTPRGGGGDYTGSQRCWEVPPQVKKDKWKGEKNTKNSTLGGIINRQYKLRKKYRKKKKRFSFVCVVRRFKTKLAASLARCRIKHDLLSIQCILPESVKMKQERSSSLPVYAWVNTLKSRFTNRSHKRILYQMKYFFSYIQNFGYTPIHSDADEAHL